MKWMPYVNAGLSVMVIIVFWMLLFLFVLTGCNQAAAFNRIDVVNDNGGLVWKYNQYMQAALKYGTRIRFAGKCASACTLYLHLPPEQICAVPGAYFQFHASSGGTREENAYVDQYLYRGYPQWVREWIGPRLTPTTVTMPYSYLRQYVQPCH